MPQAASRRAPADAATRARLFHALSDETRLTILDMLRAGERCVCDLQDELDAAQSRLSFHLKVLREAGLVRDRKAGRWSYYALSLERLADVEAYARELAGAGGPAPRPALHQVGKSRRPSAGPSAECCG